VAEIRTDRRWGVTSHFDNSDRQKLIQLRNSEAWPVLLDVFEQSLIEMESAYINLSVSDPQAVLANHSKLQAGWQMFTHFQQKIEEECQIFNRQMERPAIYEATEDDALRQITEPFNLHPETEPES
jgi:hypothetical protein